MHRCNALLFECLEHRSSVTRIATDRKASLGKCSTPNPQRVGSVGKPPGVRNRFAELLCEFHRGGIKCTGVSGRKHNQLPVTPRRRRLGIRRLLDHGMGIGTTDTERTDTGQAQWPVGLPFGQFVDDIEGCRLDIEFRIRFLEIDARRDDAVLYRHRALDQPGNAGGSIEMPDV